MWVRGETDRGGWCGWGAIILSDEIFYVCSLFA